MGRSLGARRSFRDAGDGPGRGEAGRTGRGGLSQAEVPADLLGGVGGFGGWRGGRGWLVSIPLGLDLPHWNMKCFGVRGGRSRP